jgi:ubiquinone/menaquinone biosynthesis C-methylase UbiE
VREAAFALSLLGRVPQGAVLDLCCGDGRHSCALMRAGCSDVVGMDLSSHLLGLANELEHDEGQTLRLVRGDMRRIPFAENHFHTLFNFFTSFGYFDDEGNQGVLREMARVLCPGGNFLLDYLNPEAVIAGLIPFTERETAVGRVQERRRFDKTSQRIIKNLTLYRANGEVETYAESVRAYSHEEMMKRLAVVGMCPQKVFGSFDGEPFSSESPRMLIFGQHCGSHASQSS